MKTSKFLLVLAGVTIGSFILTGFKKTGTGLHSDRSKTASVHSYPMMNLVSYVNPFSGTGKDGNTYPGATAPFGMIQWSPDTGTGHTRGGYNYRDSTIWGFSLDHLSGAGCYYAEDFSFMPLSAKQKLIPPANRFAFLASFSHANESAKPGYYSVKMNNGIKVELTATTRSGFGRFIYPGSGPATISVNAASNIRGTILSSIHVDPAKQAISGSAVSGHFCGGTDTYVIYFYAVFDQPFKSFSTWNGNTLKKNGLNSIGPNTGVFLTFNLPQNRTLLAKVGISYVSTENAKKNLETENPVSEFSSKDFDTDVKKAANNWNSWLNKIQIHGGTNEEKKTFYSMMYHTMLGPTICSDVNGQYMGYDGKVHTIKDHHVQYANFSGWDIYRSESQLLAMIAPGNAGDMAQSLLVDYQQGGAFPRWGVADMDSGVMMGDPAAPIISDFYAFGVRNFDANKALKGLIRAATNPSVRAPRSHTHERDALASYLRLGYVPENQKGGYGNVSMTLEYASADFALSRFAKSLGDHAASVMLLKHAQNWQNLYNPKTGFLQMRRRNGTWAPGVADNASVYDHDRAYVEGTAEQYTWMVPFNYRKLAKLMGGPEAAARRLDRFFTRINGGFKSKYAFLGNEPCLETPWIYDFLGEPYKTQETVRRAINNLYSSNPIGYPGNDDLGEMSSWYIFSALGMYPELPGSDILVLGSPLFSKAVIHLKNGDVTIEGKNASRIKPYVRKLLVNGRKWNKSWIRFSDVSHGGKLVYKLSSTPDKKWGSAPGDGPPSYQ